MPPTFKLGLHAASSFHVHDLAAHSPFLLDPLLGLFVTCLLLLSASLSPTDLLTVERPPSSRLPLRPALQTPPCFPSAHHKPVLNSLDLSLLASSQLSPLDVLFAGLQMPLCSFGASRSAPSVVSRSLFFSSQATCPHPLKSSTITFNSNLQAVGVFYCRLIMIAGALNHQMDSPRSFVDLLDERPMSFVNPFPPLLACPSSIARSSNDLWSFVQLLLLVCLPSWDPIDEHFCQPQYVFKFFPTMPSVLHFVAPVPHEVFDVVRQGRVGSTGGMWGAKLITRVVGCASLFGWGPAPGTQVRVPPVLGTVGPHPGTIPARNCDRPQSGTQNYWIYCRPVP
eukprot:Gb_00562 [translate_table: standard]